MRWGSRPVELRPRRSTGLRAFLPLLTVALTGIASGQMYAFDPRNPPSNAAANIYFGSTKDNGGNFLAGVTVRLEVGSVTYVYVTDDAGRFKMELAKEVQPGQVKFTCAKPGYVQLRASKRGPPSHAPSPIQADCVLEAKSISAR